MVDQLSAAYADYLQGSYDCPDRIVLTAYHRLASSAGGFRYWWRRLYGSDENLDKTHLIRLSGRAIGGSKLTRTNTTFQC
ncbi:MAG: hypothetical protein HS114_33840 [Anaerolineales bacterium]|nr:hypothetical protein [Anaerolineales bacterium]